MAPDSEGTARGGPRGWTALLILVMLIPATAAVVSGAVFLIQRLRRAYPGAA